MLKLSADIWMKIVELPKIFTEKIRMLYELMKNVSDHAAQIAGVERQLVSLEDEYNPFQSDNKMMARQANMLEVQWIANIQIRCQST